MADTTPLALAAGLLETLAVQDRHDPTPVANAPGVGQSPRRLAHACAANAEHVGQELVGERELRGVHTVGGHQEPPSLALAVNERLDELAGARVPYTRVVSEAKPDHGPLAALLEVLEGTRLAPPERLIEAVGAAGRALGVHIVYLVDYDQRRLVPLVEPGLPDLPNLEVDATLAGRAFRLVEPLSANVDGQQRLWVPLLDGVERLGSSTCESGWDPRRLRTLEVRMEHGISPFAEAVSA